MPVNGHKQRDEYIKWWVGKMCRSRYGNEFKRVVDVTTYGPPSYVYGTAVLTFEDGTEENVYHRGKRPMKKDVEVMPDHYKIKYGPHIMYIKPIHGYVSCNLYLDPMLKTQAVDGDEIMSVDVMDLIGMPHWPYKVNPEKVEFDYPYNI